MYYEINVSIDGQHLFATAPRSINSRAKLLSVLEWLKLLKGCNFEVTYHPEDAVILASNDKELGCDRSPEIQAVLDTMVEPEQKGPFKVGDIVVYRAAFLKAIQWHTDVPVDGKVVSFGDKIALVDWCYGECSHIAVKNLILKSKMHLEAV